ncbi:MAG: hypothetical protein ABIX12_13430 [Rubrivivax sp.]
MHERERSRGGAQACAQALSAAGGLPAHGASAVSSTTYRWSYSLSSAEVCGGA